VEVEICGGADVAMRKMQRKVAELSKCLALEQRFRFTSASTLLSRISVGLVLVKVKVVDLYSASS